MRGSQTQPKPSPSTAPSVPVLAIGLMSGTSQDVVDVALIETDGDVITRFGRTAYRSYSKDERALLRSATAAAENATERTATRISVLICSRRRSLRLPRSNIRRSSKRASRGRSGLQIRPSCLRRRKRRG